jgi:hypothetical protein
MRISPGSFLTGGGPTTVFFIACALVTTVAAGCSCVAAILEHVQSLAMTTDSADPATPIEAAEGSN